MAAKVTFILEDENSESIQVNLFGPQQTRVNVANVLGAFETSQVVMEDGRVLEANEDGLSMDTFLAGSSHKVSRRGGPSKRRRTFWRKREKQLPALVLDVQSPTVQIPQEYFEDSGLEISTATILYCRDTLRRQFKFLTDVVMESSAVGMIFGPPGVGKSIVTYAFASTIDRKQWTVLWAHVGSRPRVLKFGNTLDWIGDVAEIRDLHDLLESDKLEPCILFFDGYLAEAHRDLFSRCLWWVQVDTSVRRLVFVSSMASRGKISEEDEKVNKIIEFFVDSWTFDEYLSAVAHREFFEQVKGFLDSSVSLDQALAPKDLVQSKFHFAGGSCRWMFHCPTQNVIDSIKRAVTSLSDVNLTATGAVGERSRQAVNRLYNSYYVYGEVKQSFVSQYAASQIGIKVGPEAIRNLAATMNFDGNDAMDGWLLESWFFASLRRGGLTLQPGGEMKEVGLVTWDADIVRNFDPETLPDIPAGSAVWLKPTKWNQGCYDAVYVNRKSELVRFVQVTRGNRHSLKLQFVYTLLKKFADKFESKKLEICFLVPKTRLASFTVGPVEGSGLLVEYGWDKGDEVNRVTTYGLEVDLPNQWR